MDCIKLYINDVLVYSSDCDPDPPPPDPIPETNLWLTAEEATNLPDSGPLWDNVLEWATKDLTPILCDQNNQGDAVAVAAAMAYLKTGDQVHYDTALAKIAAVVGTEQGSGCAEGGKRLAAARNLAGYVVAADMLGFREPYFVEWVARVIDLPLWYAGDRYGSIYESAIIEPTNGGCHARTSAIAALYYLEDSRLEGAISRFQDWLGQSGEGWDWDLSESQWQATYPDLAGYRGINPAGSIYVIDGIERRADGVMPEDQKRSGDLRYPFPVENYVREGLQGVVATARIVSRLGYSDVWYRQDAAVLRAFEWFITEAGGDFTGDDASLPYMIDHIFGTSFATDSEKPGKNGLGFYNWLTSG